MFERRVPLDQETSAASQRPERRMFLVVVDESREMRAALRFACRRARNTGGRVALLSVSQSPEFQHWMFVGNLMSDEARAHAEERLHAAAAQVHSLSASMPELYLREGNVREELLKLVNEDEGISIVVLAAGSGPKGPGPLVAALTGKHAGKLRVPLTIVPGDLSDERIDDLT